MNLVDALTWLEVSGVAYWAPNFTRWRNLIIYNFGLFRNWSPWAWELTRPARAFAFGSSDPMFDLQVGISVEKMQMKLIGFERPSWALFAPFARSPWPGSQADQKKEIGLPNHE